MVYINQKQYGGGNLDINIEVFNNVVKVVVRERRGSKTNIYLLYSRQEPTYEDAIIVLRRDLIENGYNCVEKEEPFTEYGDVGKYFPAFVSSHLKV